MASDAKKSGVDKLSKLGKTTSESDILYALRHGKITQQEATAINPDKFPDTSNAPKSVYTVDLKKGKITKEKSTTPAEQTNTTTKTPVINVGGMVLKTPVGSQKDHQVTSVDRKTGKSK
jgi:hypothetical protein